jgi:hypothetical protein
MRKFSFYDYSEDGMRCYDYGEGKMQWVEEKYYYNPPKEWQDYQNGYCIYVATFLIEDDKVSLDIYSRDLDYAPFLEEKAREFSKYCEISCDYDQDKEFCNYFISKGWVIQRLNLDTAEMLLS